jgi:hypothetical protein
MARFSSRRGCRGPRRWLRAARRSAPWLLLPLVTACGEGGGEALLSDYATRLARPLDVGAAEVGEAVPLRPPRTAVLQVPIAGGDLDGLDFLRLRGCALQQTIARRNSSLGRVAPPSQRLLLELAFLREAPACIELMREENKPELAALLQDARQQKREQLPALIFNATLGSLEYRDFWRGATELRAYPEETGSEVITALEQVTASARRWLRGDYAADDAGFERALGRIARGDGGELLRALRLQARWLSAANTLIDRRLQDGDLCRAGRVPQAAPILRTVVQKFFLAGVQPWSAAVNERYHALLPPLRELEESVQDVLPAAYREWSDQRDRHLEEAREAPAYHVSRLQALLGPCYAPFARDGAARA